MQAEVNGQIIELSEAGWLLNLDEWSQDLAAQIAVTENVPELNRGALGHNQRSTRIF